MTPALLPRTCRAMRSTRRVISAAARREKVISRIRRGLALLTIRWATRCASVLVFPDPAPAMTRSGVPGAAFLSSTPCSTARRCSGLRVSRYATDIGWKIGLRQPDHSTTILVLFATLLPHSSDRESGPTGSMVERDRGGRIALDLKLFVSALGPP